uniref:Beta-1,4-galactosyltransferase n=1 Tax=Schistosoma japonicum TaxID=6182 RepID=Q5D9C1_SCHJA|nr:SJCHGC05297 protein [Schistosoma japonicum]
MKYISKVKLTFVYLKYHCIRIILFILLLYIIGLFITNKLIVYTTIHDQETIINSQIKLIIPQTCRNICHELTNISKEKLNNLQSFKAMHQLWPNYNADLITLYNISDLHLSGGSWVYHSNTVDYSKHNENNSKIIHEGYCEEVLENGVAIIIDIIARDQLKQLYITLSTLIPLLQMQQLCYRIFIIEQINNNVINKGKLKNIGFIEALKYFKFQCVIFHDVDLAPINYTNSYRCDEITKHMVVHLSVGTNVNKFKLPYSTYIGGVLKMSTHHFISVNGYSNKYWSLNNEHNDDFVKRLNATDIKYVHVDGAIGRYIYIPSTRPYLSQSINSKQLLTNSVKRMNSDGLNSAAYKVVSYKELPFFTHLLVLI